MGLIELVMKTAQIPTAKAADLTGGLPIFQAAELEEEDVLPKDSPRDPRIAKGPEHPFSTDSEPSTFTNSGVMISLQY